MPLYKTEKGLLYFAHLPLAGGALFDRYLAARFGAPALHQPRYCGAPTSAASSPVQHIERQQFAKWFPANFLDYLLALVRHPTLRLVAAYQLRQRRTGDAELADFSSWLAGYAEAIASDSAKLPGDLRWQSSFLPPHCRLFKLEGGLEPVADYLDEQFGPASRELLKLPQAAAEQSSPRGGQPKAASDRPTPPVVTANDHRIIGEIYQRDFTLLSYPVSAPRVLH
ncbi:hypothetical protein E3W66_03000 [Gammaproteobacteria bacterium LSUCC0057]|uniref:Sulfotransferase family protein n=1 Tax=Gammaproteobacteria bacterium LSUCC0057 TaxID=2559237 RepID=A0A4Y8UMR3_9GAMM|nr:hypothetical protein E3W66_03000 [Gammaproteobacteria bacterium LSUCC0057]